MISFLNANELRHDKYVVSILLALKLSDLPASKIHGVLCGQHVSSMRVETPIEPFQLSNLRTPEYPHYSTCIMAPELSVNPGC